MKTVRDVMRTDVIRLSPTNKVKTAIILMKGHSIGGLPVLENDHVVGVLDYQDILGRDNDVPIENIMHREFVTIPPDMPIPDAADLMAKIGSGRLLVMDSGILVGVVTRGDLLPELGKSFDPITGLARADSMRDWGIAALRRGQEVTVIFIDVDQLGPFNKKYGHITGDKVLKHVAQILRSSIDIERDMLCRYAGDEFVIVTTRNSVEARELANALTEKLPTTENADLPEPVTGSIGVYGGKRSKERELVHYEATLDNLINLASKSCTVAKAQSAAVASLDAVVAAPETASEAAEAEPAIAAPETAPEAAEVEPAIAAPETAPEAPEVEPAIAAPAPRPAPHREEVVPGEHRRLRIRSLSLSWGSGSTATAEVELANGEDVRGSSHSGFAPGTNALRLVVEAAADAVSEFLPSPGYGVIAESVNVVRGTTEEDIVLVTALVVTPQHQVRACGSSLVKQDIYRAAVAALLDAVNRQISTLI